MASSSLALSPVEAYEGLIRFATERGEHALRLAFHAAVPQVLRPEVLHLLRLNFVAESGDDPAVEADVLLAPFCEDLGHGYYRLDRNARLRLLAYLDPSYEGDPVARSTQVAGFLAAYFGRPGQEVAAGGDPLYQAYLETERWVALAFWDPDAAAAQLAGALQQLSEPGEVAARMRIGGLVSALSTPLAGHQRLLVYAAGVEALQSGQADQARELLEGLGDAEVRVGGIALRPGTSVLEAWTTRGAVAPSGEADVEPEQRISDRKLIFISHSSQDDEWGERLGKGIARMVDDYDVLSTRDTRFSSLFRRVSEVGGDRTIARTRVAVVLVSRDYLESDYGMKEELPRLVAASDQGRLRLTWVCLEACDWATTPLARYQALRDPSLPLNSLRGRARDKALSAVAGAVARMLTREEPTPQRRPQPGARIFVCYRRDDSADLRPLVDRLRKDFGDERLFVDFADLVPGAAFQDAIRDAIRSAGVMLVPIGPRWRSLARREAQAGPDFLEREIAMAFEHNVPVVPVLLEGAAMPRVEELPEGIRKLAQLDAAVLTEGRWEEGYVVLRAALGRLLDAPGVPEASAEAGEVVTDAEEVAPASEGRLGKVLLLVAGKGHRVLFHALSDALARLRWEPVAPDFYMGRRNAMPEVQKLLRSVRFLVVDSALPGNWPELWIEALRQEASPPPVALILEKGHAVPDVWKDAQGEPWLLPALVYADTKDLVKRVKTGIVEPAERLRNGRRGAAEDRPPGVARPLRVVVAASHSDLAQHRLAAAEAIARLGHAVFMTEAAVVSDPSLLRQVFEEIGACDVLVCAVAWRYGYVPLDPTLNPEGKSYTELQYREAVRLGKPILVFLLDEEAPWPRNLTDAVTGDAEAGVRAKLFRRYLESQERNVFTFSTPGQLGERVATALREFAARPDRQPRDRRDGRPVQRAPIVFISHRAEKREHQRRVRRLGEQLQAGGIDVALDQFFRGPRGGPPEGWPAWTARQVAVADKILVVASQEWADAAAAEEARLIVQRVYELSGSIARVVLFDSTDAQWVPAGLRGYATFDGRHDLDPIIAWITGKPATQVRSDRGTGAALEELRLALAAAQRLAREDPDDVERQRDLALTHNRVGDALSDSGRIDEAMTEYQAAREITERLVRQKPGHSGRAHDLSISHRKIGDVLLSQGRLDQALAKYLESLDIVKRLLAREPENPTWRRVLAISHERIGDTHRASARLAESLAHYNQAMQLFEDLVARDPGNVEWQRDLSICYERMGRVLRDQGDLDGALRAYQSSLAVCERMPANPQSGLDLATACGKVAEALLANPKGNRQEALSLVTRGLQRMAELSKERPLTPLEENVRVWLEGLRSRPSP